MARKRTVYYLRIAILSLCNIIILQNAHAKDTNFILPAACTYAADCWAVNYVDVDPSENAKDFKCNAKTYDGHKGTDFALSSIAQMRKGVDVLAAAAGTVLRLRDGETDTLKTEEEMASIRESRKECGNGIFIDHGEGLQTIYCHLKKDSITVKPDQKVSAGEKIAQIGQSGLAEFPHLHFGVTRDGSIIDPYTGLPQEKECGQQTKDSLWHIGLPIHYEPVAIFDGGFRSNAPDFEAIKRGEENPETLSLKSAALVFWTGFYNIEANDKITLTVTDPNGNIFVEQHETPQKNRARQYYFTGRKIGRVQLMPGIYTGHAKIERKSKDASALIIKEREFTVIIN